MSDLHERGVFSGALVAGVDDQIVYEGGFGLADLAAATPFDPDTPAHGASLAKTVTAAIVHVLVEEGRIDLNDSVQKYLPEFPYEDVTVLDLLTHRSGLHPEGAYFGPFAPRGTAPTNELLLEILAEHNPPVGFEPGTEFEYSGTGFALCELLAERITGESFASLVQERLFGPLGMESSYVRLFGSSGPENALARSYRAVQDGAMELYEPSGGYFGSTSVVFSTRDLYHWASSFYLNPFLRETTLQSGLEGPPIGERGRSSINELSWYFSPGESGYYFTGHSWGHYSFAYWDADRRISFAYMSNTDIPPWLRSSLAMALIDILEDGDHDPVEDPGFVDLDIPVWEPTGPPPELSRFAPILGEYEVDGLGRVSITNPPEGWLNVDWILSSGWPTPIVRVNGGPRYNVFPVRDGLYVPGLDVWIGFTEDEEGRVLHWTRVLEGHAAGRRLAELRPVVSP